MGITLSQPPPTHGVSTGGNTAGNTGTVANRLVLVGTNAISLSQATDSLGATVSINVAAQSVQVVQSALAASNTTYTSGVVLLTGSNMITVKSSGAGQTVIIDATQSVQVVQSAIAASNTTYTSGLVTITGVGGGVTVSSNTGQRIDISVAAPVAQTAQTGISGVAASNTTYSSGTITITGVGGGVTVSSNTGQRVDISVAAPVAQTVQTQNLVDVTLSGNTSGALALVSSGTLTLAGGNNITLSQAGNAITISGAAAGGAQTAISGVAASNTTYTSGTITITGVGGGVTVSSNTGQRVDISVAAPVAQSVQTQNLVAVSATNTLYSSGTVLFTGSNMITVKSSGAGQTIILDATQSVQVVQSAIAASNTTYTSGVVSFTGVGGGVTVSSNTGQRVDISVAAQSVQVVQSAIAASNTTYTSGAVSFTGVGGGVTVSSNTGQRVDISVAAPVAQTVQTQNLVDVTLSGNTSGALALVSSGTLTLAGGNNITLSQAGNAVTISGAAAGGAQTAISSIAASNTTYTSGGVTITGTNRITVRSTTGQGIAIDGVWHDVSLSGNSTSSGGGFALISSGTMILIGGPNITINQNLNRVQIEGGAGAGGGVAIAASNTTYTSGTAVFSASDGSRSAISVASVGAQSVIVSDAGPQLAWFDRGLLIDRASGVIGFNRLTMAPLVVGNGNRFPGRMTASIFRVGLSFNQSNSAQISAALSSSLNVFVYTRTSNSLSLLNSASWTFGNTVATSNNSTNWHGNKFIDITNTTAWSSRPDFVYGGEYYVGLQLNSHITTGNSLPRLMIIHQATAPLYSSGFGKFGAVSDSSVLAEPFWGVLSLSASNHIRTTISHGEVSIATNVANNLIAENPYIVMIESTFLS